MMLAAHTSSYASAVCLFVGANTYECSGNTVGDTVVGTTGNDIFKFLADARGQIYLYSGGGDDTIDLSLLGFDLTININAGGGGGTQVYQDPGNPGIYLYLGYNGFGAVELIGGSGNDAITGGTGNDTLTGNGGNDNISGGGGSDTINGGDGSDIINGGADNDTINAGDGSDTVNGGDGNDTINGDAGVDSLSGNNGNDTINGGDDTDAINGDAGNDTINGNAGVDGINGGDDDDTINGGAGNDGINGGTGNDSINGGDDDDSVNGDDGDDTVNGGAGIDSVAGGPGNDTRTDSLPNCAGDTYSGIETDSCIKAPVPTPLPSTETTQTGDLCITEATRVSLVDGTLLVFSDFTNTANGMIITQIPLRSLLAPTDEQKASGALVWVGYQDSEYAPGWGTAVYWQNDHYGFVIYKDDGQTIYDDTGAICGWF